LGLLQDVIWNAARPAIWKAASPFILIAARPWCLGMLHGLVIMGLMQLGHVARPGHLELCKAMELGHVSSPVT
jgi:hypothetical protein